MMLCCGVRWLRFLLRMGSIGKVLIASGEMLSYSVGAKDRC
jgi:hypothetical protein